VGDACDDPFIVTGNAPIGGCAQVPDARHPTWPSLFLVLGFWVRRRRT
jgi:hypothetical protein